ncbi:MAG: hypothetical protein LBD27_00880 [Tannerella sp.]|nr:hypothetical protein [Tannerella sp.]
MFGNAFLPSDASRRDAGRHPANDTRIVNPVETPKLGVSTIAVTNAIR